ncbi:hypothetical protein [Bacteroides acidifaciens]|uniref:hypothetical protein n=1 Tax=Bacteroides acidifaciens TaxID=85831 RepID=UPI003F6910CE
MPPYHDRCAATLYPIPNTLTVCLSESIDVINNFPLSGYPRLLREIGTGTDLQGIIIVGDINVDEIEAKLKKGFRRRESPVNPAESIYYPVADNQEPLI